MVICQDMRNFCDYAGWLEKIFTVESIHCNITKIDRLATLRLIDEMDPHRCGMSPRPSQ